MWPLTTPGGKPTTEPAGFAPRSPLRSVAPVLVTPVPPSTEYDPALPSDTAASAAYAGEAPNSCPRRITVMVTAAIPITGDLRRQCRPTAPVEELGEGIMALVSRRRHHQVVQVADAARAGR